MTTVLYCIGRHTEEVTDSIQVGQFVSKLFSTKLLLLFGGPAGKDIDSALVFTPTLVHCNVKCD